jgi:hypothetical protein
MGNGYEMGWFLMSAECYDLFILMASVFGGPFESFVDNLLHNDKWIH